MEVQKIAIDTDTIQLDQFLKWAGVTTTGGDIRTLLDNRQIKRNGETESAKRRKLVPGDVIEIEGVGSYEVVKESE
ncbi:RNA-binding S4 domain-containing protein [uncultured Selenomonas sp.]|jgi:ribosome-associated protein|uniref:RNA-binding S4 domain-containing protein n=1 Tax=uncultured Selenomonas sp. TaxID=159275 RepID=UPI0025D08AB3|nr:RNA-binding S4 domain-containing protein [uncultured Selenomonas sp.]MDD6127764.1 RNA-binding S4 domain-containing protein [Veillonellaceae bacterium]MDD6698709.1 RNA-binding S4 domain-containing protein [Veillonellaceae bacterium]